MRRIAVAVCLAIGSASPAFAERVIVKCNQSCDSVAAAVTQDGGRVLQRFKYVTALVADVQDLSLPRTRMLVDAGAIRKDLYVSAIDVRDARGDTLTATVDALAVQALDVDAPATPDIAPAADTVNNVLTNVQPIHAAGFKGRGMKVAVLDTGIRLAVVPGTTDTPQEYPHIAGKVIGGEDFVHDGLGFSNIKNNGHGTFTAGLIAGNVTFTFAPNSAFLDAVRTECASCVAGNSVPMVGSAPEASIYAVRVLGANGSGRQSDVIAGMERVIDLRRAYEAGHPETQNADGSYNALNIRVANMSLGGTTLFPGRDVEDELTNAFLDNDIVLVVAAGNNGPSGGTVASPGSGFGSLTVGAASTAIHERILRDLTLLQAGFGLHRGRDFRPFGGTQTASFSSRGPNADGRPDPDVVANGFASFGQGFGANSSPFVISLASGTSASAPTVAGIAAVLRQAVPNVTARQVRNALILTADPTVIQDGSGPNDQGAGFVNATAARAMLTSIFAPALNRRSATGGMNNSVAENIQRLAGIETFSGDVTRSTGELLPGQRFETFYYVPEGTAAVFVTLSEVKPGETQNMFFGDDVLLTVHSSKMSAVPGPNGQAGDYRVVQFGRDGRFVIQRPEPGIMRITVNGDTTNASRISATISVSSFLDPEFGRSARDRIKDGDTQAVPFTVPVGARHLSLKAEWRGDWGSYPANDIDVVLQSPDGKLNFDGATLDNPERVEIADPLPGKWTAFILGSEVNSRGGDKYSLRILVDGQLVGDGKHASDVDSGSDDR